MNVTVLVSMLLCLFFFIENSRMLRNWKQLCLLSSHLKFGYFYPTVTCKEFTRRGQILCKQTFVSLCYGCNLQIDQFHVPLTNAESTLKCEARRRLHQSDSVKPDYGTSSKGADVKSNYSGEIDPDWTVHERLITTCAGLWEDNPDGSNFIVSYVDTASQLTKPEKSHMPTVLAVARDLAHSDSLKPLLGSLARNGFRVIMPYLVGWYAFLTNWFSMYLQIYN